jgi:hypothetical protein
MAFQFRRAGEFSKSRHGQRPASYLTIRRVKCFEE